MTIRSILSYPLLALLLSVVSFSALSAHRVSQSSGAQTMAVLELYTSEGCSSCPPAEKYLQQLTSRYGTDKTFIPLAFHVDYWDYIGWEDPFAQRAYSNRQRRVAMRNKLRSIYTPQFVLHGKDFRAHNNIPKAIDVINAIEPAADFTVNASLDNKRLLSTEVILEKMNAASSPHADMRIFITENNLVSNIQDGENAGLELKHDHVVRHMTAPLPFPHETQPGQSMSHKIQLDPQWKLTDLNLVVLIQDGQNGATLQAVKLPLEGLID